MSMFYLVLALLFGLLIAVVAMANSVNVIVYYLFGHAQISLIVLILGSACAGALAMGFFALFRGIRTHFLLLEAHRNRVELQDRLDLLEKEKIMLEADIGRRQLEFEAVAVKGLTTEEVSKAGDAPEPSGA